MRIAATVQCGEIFTNAVASMNRVHVCMVLRFFFHFVFCMLLFSLLILEKKEAIKECVASGSHAKGVGVAISFELRRRTHFFSTMTKTFVFDVFFSFFSDDSQINHLLLYVTCKVVRYVRQL